MHDFNYLKDEETQKHSYNTSMSLVSNFIGGIGVNPDGGINGITQQFDLSDTTFSDLLEKQIDTKESEKTNPIISGHFGIPAGMQIDGMDGAEFSEKAFDQAEAIGAKTDTYNEEKQNNNIFDTNNDGEVTSSEMLTFFTSLLDNGAEGEQTRSELFDFARKQAANFYNKYSKSVVNNISELAADVKSLNL